MHGGRRVNALRETGLGQQGKRGPARPAGVFPQPLARQQRQRRPADEVRPHRRGQVVAHALAHLGTRHPHRTHSLTPRPPVLSARLLRSVPVGQHEAEGRVRDTAAGVEAVATEHASELRTRQRVEQLVGRRRQPSAARHARPAQADAWTWAGVAALPVAVRRAHQSTGLMYRSTVKGACGTPAAARQGEGAVAPGRATGVRASVESVLAEGADLRGRNRARRQLSHDEWSTRPLLVSAEV